MDAAIEPLDFDRHRDELLETWQAKVLLGSEGMMRAVILSVLAHSFDDAMPTLLRAAFPGFYSICAPFFCTAARIMRSGHVCADLVTADGLIEKYHEIFPNEIAMRSAFRRLADTLKLDDRDRRQLFAAAQRWVVCDFRLDPNMNPDDPNAKRLVH